MLSRALALSIILLAGTSVHAADLTSRSKLAENWVLDVYQPAFRHFANAATRWASASEDLCGSTRGSRIYALQTTFTELVADYAKVEVFRSGPMLDNNFQNRLFYWPDTRRVGERQLRSLLASTEITDLSVQQLARKSVAVQGFPALERLLFNHAYQAVETAPQCHVVQAIIQNIASMATQLDSAWQSEASFVQDFLNPHAVSDDFRSEDEVLRSVMTDVVVGLDILIDRKLQPLLSGDPRIMRTTPLWQSQRTVAMLEGNTSSIRSLLFNSELLSQTEAENFLTADFDYVSHLLQRLKYRFSFTDDEGQLDKDVESIFTSLSAVLSGIRHTVKYQIVSPLGIGVGFNAEDGD